MNISVVCPGCKVRFNVSDKFAGKKGPCPKCKAVITIPLPPKEEIKVHAPEEFASGGKDAQGRAVLKPITRKETKVQPVMIVGIACGALVVLGACFALRSFEPKWPVVALGLALISAPLAVGGYAVLREQELEAYSGRELWVRAIICGAVYSLLWALYIPLSNVMTGEMYEWLVAAPVFAGIGALAAYAALDLEFATGALHYSFFLLVTLLLRAALGLPPIWATTH